MELFTTLQGFTDVFLRWLHILAGITWIGLLYYFNLVQAPFMNEANADVKGAATRSLVPRALFWFRYSALATFLVGATIVVIRVVQEEYTFDGSYGALILSGGLLGTVMFLNVWGVIWPKQKIVIGSARSVAEGGSADERAADSARRAMLASRTNVLFSIPMLFFMVLAPHGSALIGNVQGSSQMTYWVVFGVVALLVELNCLVGLTGGLKRPLEKIGQTVVSGLVVFAVLYGTLVGLGG